MDPILKSAIARIDVIEGANHSRGTGCLVADGYVLTAFHVIGDRDDPNLALYPGEITLTFPGFVTTATLHETCWDKKNDWALLICVKKPAARPVPLSVLEEDKISSALWESFGFPDIHPEEGMKIDGKVSDSNHLQEAEVLQLFCNQSAAGTGSPVRGLSGGPVIVDGAMVGLFRFALMDEDLRANVAGTLYACPVPSLIEKCGDLLPLPDHLALPGFARAALPNLPFRYLDSFAEEHAEVFFGRDHQIVDLYKRLTRACADASGANAHPVTLLYGQSGVGKSSLLAAGLTPRLRSRYLVKYLVRTPERSLSELLMSELDPVASSAGLSELAARWLATEQRSGQSLIVIVDQLEEVFTLPCATAPDDLAEFAAALQEIFAGERRSQSTPQGRLVLAFRKEWLPDVQKKLERAKVDCGEMFLESLDQRGIVEVVQGLRSTPRLLEKYRLRIDDEQLPVRIALYLLADHNSAVAPALQILMTKMWSKARELDPDAPRFTGKLWEDLQKDGLGFDDFLAQQLEALSAKSKALGRCVESGLALDLLYSHTTEMLTGRQRPLSDTTDDYAHCEALPELLDSLQQLFLLTGARDSSGEATRLSHDTLARAVRQSAEHSETIGQRARRILEGRVAVWDKTDDDALEPGALGVVDKGRYGMRKPKPVEEALIKASYRKRSSSLLWKQIRMGPGALAVALVTTAAIVASVYYLRSKRQLELATFRYQASQSLNDWLEVKPFRAMVQAIAVAGESLNSPQGRVIPEAQAALFAALSKATESNIIPGFHGMVSMAVSRDGMIAVADPSDKDQSAEVSFWTLSGAPAQGLQPVEIKEGFTATNMQGPVAFSPDGQLLAIGGDGIRLGRSNGADMRKPFARATGSFVYALAFSADSNYLFSGHSDGMLRAWKRDGSKIAEVRANLQPAPAAGELSLQAVNVLAAARGFQQQMLVASGGPDNLVHIWEFDGHKFLPKAQLKTAEDEVSALAFRDADTNGDNGGELAAGTAGSLLYVWDAPADPGGSWNLLDDPPYNAGSPVQAVAFTTNGKYLAVGSADGVIHFVTPAATELAPPFQGFTTGIQSLSFRKDGTLIAADERSVGMLDMGRPNGSQISAVTAYEYSAVNGLGFLKDKSLVVGTYSDRVHFWDRSKLTFRNQLAGGEGQARFLALAGSPDGSMFASSDSLGRVLLFDSGGRRKGDHGGEIGSRTDPDTTAKLPTYPPLLFFPDSKRLAVSRQGDLGIWAIEAQKEEPKIHSPSGPIVAFDIIEDAHGPLVIAAVKGAGKRQGRVEFWRLSGQLDENKPPVLIDTAPISIAGRPDGKGFVVGDASGALQCYAFDGNGVEKVGGLMQVGKKEVRWIQVDKKSERIFAATLDGAVLGLFYPAERRSRKRDEASTDGQTFARFRFGYEFGGAALSQEEDALAVGGRGAMIVFHADWRSWLKADCERVKNHVYFKDPSRIGGQDAAIIERARKVCEARPWENAGGR